MDNLLMDMVYLGCGVIFGLLLRKVRVVFRKQEWVDLTDDEMLMIYGQDHVGKKYSLGRMVQTRLKEKNGF